MGGGVAEERVHQDAVVGLVDGERVKAEEVTLDDLAGDTEFSEDVGSAWLISTQSTMPISSAV
ncbi:hypothetical protein [Streptomyces sp. NPDC002573]|uniref:hypothetical protein n=1 Tax=Streptomyces sp. NPDC002573 TaxID=3364651 RepID=UPI0036B89291